MWGHAWRMCRVMQHACYTCCMPAASLAAAALCVRPACCDGMHMHLPASKRAVQASQLISTVLGCAACALRHRERPRRPWVVWLLDVSKQAASAGAGHIVGMGVAIVAHAKSQQATECGWYFVVRASTCTTINQALCLLLLRPGGGPLHLMWWYLCGPAA